MQPHCSLQHNSPCSASRPTKQTIYPICPFTKTTPNTCSPSCPCAGPPCHEPLPALQLQGACSRRSSLGGRERLTAVFVCVTLGQDTTSTSGHYCRLHPSVCPNAGSRYCSIHSHSPSALLSIFYYFNFSLRFFIHFRFSPSICADPCIEQPAAPATSTHLF